MAGHKETPRQKMISMMYLVLTALLALNVSKEVLTAFVVVNESIVRTNLTFSQKIDDSYGKFERSYQLNQTEVLPFWTKALEAQKLSKELIDYIENLRIELIAHTESIEKDSAKIIEFQNLVRLDDNIKPTGLFMGPSETGSDGKAGELRLRLEEYRRKMLDLIEPKHRELIKLGLQTNVDFFNAEGKSETWEMHHFYDTILAADITILNKLITEVYNIEFDILNILMNSISEEDFKYDKIGAKVLPISNYIFKGDSYKAEVIVAAYDTTQSPEVYLLAGTDSLRPNDMDRATKIISEPGKVQISLPSNREGLNKYAGIIKVLTSSGGTNDYHFSGSYIVAQPTVTVSATKMNVFYIGVNNTVSISVSGIPSENLTASISCGTLTKPSTGNDWVAKVPASFKEATITVQARIDGTTRRMGTETFRIKQLPNPIASIANRTDGFIDKEIIINERMITPKMPDEFDFEYPYKIESFKLSMQRGFNNYQYESTSDELTPEMIKQITKTNRGQVLVFDNIIAVGPENNRRSVAPLIFTIN